MHGTTEAEKQVRKQLADLLSLLESIEQCESLLRSKRHELKEKLLG